MLAGLNLNTKLHIFRVDDNVGSFAQFEQEDLQDFFAALIFEPGDDLRFKFFKT